MDYLSGVAGNRINQTGYEPHTIVEKQAEPGIDFSQMIAEALREEMVQMSIAQQSGGSLQNAGSGMMSTGAMGGGSMVIEQAIIAAAASGEADEAMTAMFMMSMMMQSGMGGDSSIMMQLMGAMLSKISAQNAD